jgi:hypothetical protein
MNMINIRVACRLLWAVDGDMVVVRTVDLFWTVGSSAERTTPSSSLALTAMHKTSISAASIAREQVTQVSSLRSAPPGRAILVLRPSSQNKKHYGGDRSEGVASTHFM